MSVLEVTYIDLPEFLVEPLITRNPFKNKVLAGQYTACIRAFDTHHKDLIRTDRRDERTYQHRGNAWANHFWYGYNGVHDRYHYRGAYDTPAYACWRAGRDIRSKLK